MNTYLHDFLFTVYPYICLGVFLMGSLARFDRDQYTWKSDSSQLLRHGTLRWGSNLFHLGILFLLFGHTVGLLTPHALYAHVISAAHKQQLAVVAGGVAGAICFVGLMMVMSTLGKTEEAVSGGTWGINLFMSMFGGGMVPLAFLPTFMQTLSNFSPVKWGVLALEGAIWRGFTWSEMLPPCLTLTAIGVVGFVLGVRVLRRS